LFDNKIDKTEKYESDNEKIYPLNSNLFKITN